MKVTVTPADLSAIYLAEGGRVTVTFLIEFAIL
jgi:hypothetical protein